MGKPKQKGKRPSKPTEPSDNGKFDIDKFDDYEDEVDAFHSNRDKVLLNKYARHQDQEKGEDKEMFAFDDDDSDDDDAELEEYAKKLRQFKQQGFVSEMASDLEDIEDEDEEEKKIGKAWGRARKLFYGGGVEDNKRIEFDQEGVDPAVLEETEALALQKQLASQLQQEDLGLDLLQSVPDEEKQQVQITKDLTSMSKKEKLRLLKKESPELLPLIEDLKVKISDVEKLLEILKTKIQNTQVKEFVHMKIGVHLTYCMNIAFYLSLKAMRKPVSNHPVMKVLLEQRKLLAEVSVADEKLQNALNQASRKRKSVKAKKVPETVPVEEIEKVTVSKTAAEEAVVEGDEEQRRAITYQIAKNKGLTPKRKKEQRNPRLKHRMKYRKALIRRRGKIQEVRKELRPYSGEISGIRAGIIKSTKFKS